MKTWSILIRGKDSSHLYRDNMINEIKRSEDKTIKVNIYCSQLGQKLNIHQKTTKTAMTSSLTPMSIHNYCFLPCA